MLQQPVTYEDYDGVQQTEILWFNLTKTELTDNLDLQHEFEKIERDFRGEFTRELEPKEIRRVLELVKRIMKMAYGTRSDDGKRFIKNDEQWTEFTQTAVYDHFLYSLFTEPNNAVAWLTAVLPKDLREAALEAANHTGNGVSADAAKRVMEAQKVQAKKAQEAQDASAAGFAKVVEDSPEGTPLKENIVTHLTNLSAGETVEREPNGKPIMSDTPTPSELTAMMEWINNN